MGTYEMLNEVLVNLFRNVNDIEQKTIITLRFEDIANNDIHMIEVTGIDAPKNMSNVVRVSSVTVSTLAIPMNGLVKEGYAARQRNSEGRRVVCISLSEKGVKVCYHHKKFHERMIDGVVKELTKEKPEALVKALTKLNSRSRSFEKD